MTVQGTSSITPRFLVELLDAAGQPPDALLAQAGVERAQLLSPELVFPFAALHELWARAAMLQPDIGLTMVERFPSGQAPMVVHLALRSPTVRAAIEDACRHARVTSAADRFALDTGDGLARLRYEATVPAAAIPWMAEHYLSMAVLLLARAAGRELPLRRVSFVAPAQAPAAAYVRRFGIAPDFGAAHNALEFDAPALDWPLLSQDAYLHAILERVAEARAPAAAAEDSLLDVVRRELARQVLQGATPTVEDVAQACRLGPRALRARLAEAGTGFRALLDEARRELAREHLGRGLSVTETAYLLGFSEPAAFQHACKRWFGQSAGELRRARV